MSFTSTDSSVSISGNGSNSIDITVGSSVNTNIFNTDGTLSASRTVTQASNTLAFTGGDFTVDGTTLVVDESASAVSIGAASTGGKCRYLKLLQQLKVSYSQG